MKGTELLLLEGGGGSVGGGLRRRMKRLLLAFSLIILIYFTYILINDKAVKQYFSYNQFNYPIHFNIDKTKEPTFIGYNLKIKPAEYLRTNPNLQSMISKGVSFITNNITKKYLNKHYAKPAEAFLLDNIYIFFYPDYSFDFGINIKAFGKNLKHEKHDFKFNGLGYYWINENIRT